MMLPTRPWILGSALWLWAAVFAPAAPASQATPSPPVSRSARLVRHRARARPARGPVTSQVGVASFYSDSYEGHRTASGERFSNQALTAASPELPLGSRVKVTNL